MVDAARASKLADRIQRIVAEMLERRIKDPRLGFVTVTDARLTNDLRDATVYYTVFGSDAEKAATAAANRPSCGAEESDGTSNALVTPEVMSWLLVPPGSL